MRERNNNNNIRRFVGQALSLGLFACFAVAFMTAGCGGNTDLELSKKFQTAQQTFDQVQSADDFLKSAALYQEVLDAGGDCGAVLYNQGNAYMQAGQTGRAIAAYRQAMKYRPRDPYLEANLAFALGTAKSAEQRKPLMEHLLFWQNWMAYPTKFYAAAGLCLLAFALGVTGLLSDARLWRRAAIGVVVLAGLMIFSAGYDWYRYDCVEHGVIVQPEVVARKGNADSYSPAFVEPLQEGTEFRVIDRRGRWMLIRLAGGEEGWIEDDAAVSY